MSWTVRERWIPMQSCEIVPRLASITLQRLRGFHDFESVGWMGPGTYRMFPPERQQLHGQRR